MRITPWCLGYTDDEVNRFFAKALFAVGEDWGMEELLPIVLEVGEKNLKCMALLDKANTESYGTPVPVTVPLTVEKGPFIVVSGHDLHDLKLLLEQTEGKGINIYTHGEMLPAHGYPELKKYSHLKGNFGTAWQNQQKEFADLPAPVLFTTNCLMPPKASYADRVFTTSVVSYPEMTHIGEDKDFTPVIEKALELGGYAEDRSTSPASTAAVRSRPALPTARCLAWQIRSSRRSSPARSGTSSWWPAATAHAPAATTTRSL